MSQHVRVDGDVARRLFTASDVARMVEARVFEDDERFELIEGELISMSPKLFLHDRVKNLILDALKEGRESTVYVAAESTLHLDGSSMPEPDIMACRWSDIVTSPEGYMTTGAAKTLLLVEVSGSSIGYDRGLKARLYARHGEPEYWVVDLNAGVTLVHREPVDGAYRSVETVPADRALTPGAPDLSRVSVRLADFL